MDVFLRFELPVFVLSYAKRIPPLQRPTVSKQWWATNGWHPGGFTLEFSDREMGTGIDSRHWFIKKQIGMNDSAFTAISSPFLPPHPAAYVRTHVACQVQPHMNFYKLAQRKKKKSNLLSCVLSRSTQLFFFSHFVATCSVNQGCWADMAGAQAGLQWFS